MSLVLDSWYVLQERACYSCATRPPHPPRVLKNNPVCFFLTNIKLAAELENSRADGPRLVTYSVL